MINTFDELKKHVGHKIACVRLSGGGEASKVALRCNDCDVRLVILEDGDLLSKELAEDVGKTIAHVWSVDDVLAQAKERHINLIEQQCIEILQIIDREKDATVGINWDVIDTVTDDYLSGDIKA